MRFAFWNEEKRHNGRYLWDMVDVGPVECCSSTRNCCKNCAECVGMLSCLLCHSRTDAMLSRYWRTASGKLHSRSLSLLSQQRKNIPMMNDAIVVEVTLQQWLQIASIHSRFFRSRRVWGVPLRKLNLDFGVITKDSPPVMTISNVFLWFGEMTTLCTLSFQERL